MIISQQKIRILALACLIGFQPVPVKADIKQMVNSFVQQMIQNKAMVGCVAAVLVLFGGYKAAYKIYISSKVDRVEKLLRLNEVSVTGSFGYFGPYLYKRNEAMARVFNGIKNTPYWHLEQIEKQELEGLVADPVIPRELIRRQELHLMKDIAHSPDIWKTETYHNSARKMLNMAAPQHLNPYIGHLSAKGLNERKEAFKKVDPQQHEYLALKTFCNTVNSHLGTWIKNSTYLKKDLEKIHQELSLPAAQ